MDTIRPKKVQAVKQTPARNPSADNDNKNIFLNAVQQKKTIGLLIPVYGTIPAGFLNAYTTFVTQNSLKYNIGIIISEGQPVDLNRNNLIEMAMEKNFDYIFFMDSDMMIPPNAIDRLIEVLEQKRAHMVTGLYFQRNKPYQPVIREFRNGGFWVKDDIEFNQVIEINACGMGCALIKPEVFKKLEYPWFNFNYEMWGKKRFQISEDMYFCRELMKAGFKIYCDTGIVATHIGSTVDEYEFMSYSEYRKEGNKIRIDIIKEIADFTGKTHDEVELLIKDGPFIIKDEWNEKNPQTEEDIIQFYKNTENYLYDLASWHCTSRRQFDMELVAEIKAMKPKNIMDFGCGIGQNALMLAEEGMDVTIADLDSYTLRFAEQRFNKRNLKYKIWRTDLDKNVIDEKYDVILCYDVLEHLTVKQMTEVVEKLIQLKHKNTIIKITVSFGKSKYHPMHFNADPERQKLVKRLLEEYPEQ